MNRTPKFATRRSRQAGPDRAVHSDLTMLYRNGVIDKTGAGLLLMPYDIIRLDFTLDATHAA